jgi:hypothetical protein
VTSRLSDFDGRHHLSPRWSLEDALIDRYVDWREACVEVQADYECWRDAPEDERERAFVAYRAALDREERAGEVYAELVTHVAGTTKAG